MFKLNRRSITKCIDDCTGGHFLFVLWKTLTYDTSIGWTKSTQLGKASTYISLPFFGKASSTLTPSPLFYHLIKTHKTGPDMKIRPLISNTNGANQRISWLFANALKPKLKDVLENLENSLELECIQAGDFTTSKTQPYPCSLDMVSLFTSRPVQ